MEGRQRASRGAEERRREREKSQSVGNGEKMWKRKREASMEMGEEGSEGGGAVFAKSKKTPRSPGRIGERRRMRKRNGGK
jgi:hypothetical protein